MALIPLLLFLFLVSTFATQCYWPDGSNATSNWIPCPGTISCCEEGAACLSNGLCYEANLNIAHRGACADITWPMSECPRVCYEEVPNLWANLYACPNNSNQVFTCGAPGWASDVCAKQIGTYLWTSEYVSVANLTTSTATSSTATSLTSPVSASTTPTVDPTPSNPASDTSASSLSSSSSSSSSQQLALGAGLGVGLGVPFLAMAACMIWFCVQSNRRVKAMQAQNQKLQQENALIVRTRAKPSELGFSDHYQAGELEGSHPPRPELAGETVLI